MMTNDDSLTKIKSDLLRVQQEKRALYNDAWILDQVIDNIQAMIWMKDAQDRYIFASHRLCHLLLKLDNPDDAIGRTDTEIILGYRAAGERNDFGEICNATDTITRDAGKPCEFIEIAQIDKDEIVLWVRKTPIMSGDACIGTVGVAYDSLPKTTILRMVRSRERRGAAIHLDCGHYQLI